MRGVLLGTVLVLAVAAPAGAHATHVTATPQVTPDGTVYVESTAVVDPLWLVLHAGGTRGEPVGWTFLDPSAGLVTEVPVPLSAGAWANTTGARTVWIDLYFDDGDGDFDPSADSRVSQAGLFTPLPMVVRRGDARAYVGARTERAQPTTGAVTVRRAILPADGYLVLRNVSGDAVVGRTSLAAGTHSNVTVRLDEGFYASRPPVFSLRATLHVDDGDGRFDDGDRPVRVGEAAVHTRVRLTKRAEDATPTPGEAALVTTPTDGGDGRNVGPAAIGVGLVAAVVSLVVLLAVGRYRR